MSGFASEFKSWMNSEEMPERTLKAVSSEFWVYAYGATKKLLWAKFSERNPDNGSGAIEATRHALGGGHRPCLLFDGWRTFTT